MNPSYQCPDCDEWIEILPTTNTADFQCPWCDVRLHMYAAGYLMILNDVERMIEHSMKFKHP